MADTQYQDTTMPSMEGCKTKPGREAFSEEK